MSSDEGLLSYRELIGELRRLCAEGRTGTLFITTSDNHPVRFVVRTGAITAVMFRQQTGGAALASIKRIAGGRLNYSTELFDYGPPQELPSTPELLTVLDGMAADADERGGPGGAVVAASLNRSRAIIEAELTEYLGPMAQVIYSEHVARAVRGGGSTSVNDVIESLARELGDPGKATRFKERVRARLTSNTQTKS